MVTYLARRIATSIVVVIRVSIFIFVLLQAAVPSPARDVLGLHSSSGAVAP